MIGTEWLEVRLWIAILLAQSLPYLSAMVSAWISARAGEAVVAVREPDAPDSPAIPSAPTPTESTPVASNPPEAAH